jgi:hypothetical protein
MRFDTASPTPKLVFKPVRPVTEEEFNVVQHLKDSTEAVNAITLTVAQTDGVKDKPKASLFAEEDIQEKPKAKPAKVEAEEVEEPKKATPKKAPVANEPKLEDLVGEWDDA